MSQRAEHWCEFGTQCMIEWTSEGDRKARLFILLEDCIYCACVENIVVSEPE